MTCIRRVTAFDRFILRGADPHEPACRLLVERLKWMSFFALMVAVLGVGLLFTIVQGESQAARQRTAEIVANECVDRSGDIAFRNLLARLTELNEQPPPRNPAVARQRTAAALREGLREAGEAPACILRIP